jgi:G protein-coupled receptor 158
LVEFQSRKAHSVQLKDKDILRILFFIILCVLGYLIAWTLVDLDYAEEGFSLLTNTSLKGFIQYPICKIKWWDYFIEIGKFYFTLISLIYIEFYFLKLYYFLAEFLFICVGFYLLYCTRTAPSEFNERKFISLVIYFEGIVSTLLHIIK